MSPLTIRKLKNEDINEVLRIYRLYWQDKEFLNKLEDKLRGFVEGRAEMVEQKFVYFIAEDNNEVVGVIGLRTAPEHMREYAETDNPCELYILAAKNSGHGVGKALVEHAIKYTKENSYSEIVLFSAENRKEAWGFYDHLGFHKIADDEAPNGDPGRYYNLKL